MRSSRGKGGSRYPNQVGSSSSLLTMATTMAAAVPTAASATSSPTSTASSSPAAAPSSAKLRITRSRSASRNGDQAGPPMIMTSKKNSHLPSMGSSSRSTTSDMAGDNDASSLFSPTAYDWCLFDDDNKDSSGSADLIAQKSDPQVTASKLKFKNRTEAIRKSRMSFEAETRDAMDLSQDEKAGSSSKLLTEHLSPPLPELDVDSQSEGTIDRPSTPEKWPTSKMDTTSPPAESMRPLETRRPGLKSSASPLASSRKPSFRSQVLEKPSSFADATEMQDLISAQKLFPELFEKFQEGSQDLQPSQHRRILAHLKRDLAGIDLATLRGPLRSIASHQQQRANSSITDIVIPRPRQDGQSLDVSEEIIPSTGAAAANAKDMPQQTAATTAVPGSGPGHQSSRDPSSTSKVFAKPTSASPEPLSYADPQPSRQTGSGRGQADLPRRVPASLSSNDLLHDSVSFGRQTPAHQFSASSSSSSEDDEWRRRTQGASSGISPMTGQMNPRLYPMAPPLIPYKRPFLHRDSVSSSASSGSSSRSPIGGGMTASSSSTSDDEMEEEEEEEEEEAFGLGAPSAMLTQRRPVNLDQPPADKSAPAQTHAEDPRTEQSRAPATYHDLSSQMDTTCTNCGTHFARIYDLQRHQETKHGEGAKVEWICEFCPDKKHFSRKDALQRHKRIKHGRVT